MYGFYVRCLGLMLSIEAGATAAYEATPTEGNKLVLKTPFGPKTYYLDAELTQADAYQIEIPIESLREGAHERRTRTDGLIAKANRLYGQMKFRESLKFVDEAIERDPQLTRAWIMRGSLLHALGEKAASRKAYEAAAKLDPTNQQISKILEKSK